MTWIQFFVLFFFPGKCVIAQPDCPVGRSASRSVALGGANFSDKYAPADGSVQGSIPHNTDTASVLCTALEERLDVR